MPKALRVIEDHLESGHQTLGARRCVGWTTGGGRPTEQPHPEPVVVAASLLIEQPARSVEVLAREHNQAENGGGGGI